ncbi:MAG TPA: hypothetical protein K8V91_00950 [[Clostridium] spiroforme]|uniref:Transposase n=1 Tax=Thomasclavelia spiroformis TaxID=29348 RepID=A0A921GA43_9FIRM|nr:hypothetical protein [Thomasclavelia spiroformis]
MAKKTNLNYRFHNPNKPKETVDFILNVFIEACNNKVENAIKESIKINK